MIVSFNEMHEFCINEFQDILSADLCYFITADQLLFLQTSLWGGIVSVVLFL
jgi:hypothetical protein